MGVTCDTCWQTYSGSNSPFRNRILIEECCGLPLTWSKGEYKCKKCNQKYSSLGYCDGKHKKKSITLLLAIFFGVVGFHKFYTRHITSGIIMLLLSLLGIIISLTQGIDIFALLPVLIWLFLDICSILGGSYEDGDFRYLLD